MKEQGGDLCPQSYRSPSVFTVSGRALLEAYRAAARGGGAIASESSST